MTTTTQTQALVIARPDIADKVRNLKGCRMVTIELETEPKLRRAKTNPLRGRVKKIQSINGALGYNYTNAVNRQRVKDDNAPDFEALTKKNISHVGGALLQHNLTGQLYLYMRPLHKKDAVYYVDGKLTDFEDLKDDLYFPPKKENGGRQEVSKAIPYMMPKIENVRHITGL